VQSFYKDSLVYMQTWSDFKLVYLITGTAKGPPRVDTLEKLRVIKEYSDILALPLGWGDELFAQATADAQSVGFEVHAWTTDEEAAPYEFMEGLGVTFVFTNNAAYVRARRASRKRVIGRERAQHSHLFAAISSMPRPAP